MEGAPAVPVAIASAARGVIELALERGLSVSTAESCTAGMVSSALASVPGASAALLGGAATYTEAVKHRVLGVDWDVLDTYSAVSRQCAGQMASGSRALFGSDAAVSVTGYAGPGGGTTEDPVGCVYIACATGRASTVERHVFPGDRQQVREAACLAALEVLHGALLSIPCPGDEAQASR